MNVHLVKGPSAANGPYWSFDGDKFQSFISISVVEKQLLAWQVVECVNTDSMVTVDSHDPGKTVRMGGMICKSNFAASAGGIYNRVLVQVEQKAALVPVVNLASALCFILGYDLVPLVLEWIHTADIILLLGILQ